MRGKRQIFVLLLLTSHFSPLLMLVPRRRGIHGHIDGQTDHQKGK